MTADIYNPIFQDVEKAREHLERIRWPDGAYCPHCGEADEVHRMQGKSHAPGLHYCRSCRGKFSVTVGTLFERSKIPLNKWMLAFHLMASSKKGISAHQLHRMLGITYKSAWFMAHRIREAMREGFKPHGMGGEGKVVEADETHIGGKEKNRHRNKRFGRHVGGLWGREMVFSLVERKGRVRSVHTPSVSARTLRPILVTQLEGSTKLMTDDAGQYRHMHRDFEHQAVNHTSGEYVRGEAHTNTVEGYFSLLKRGLTGTYHHVSPKHLKRYLAEFDFRYNYRMALEYSDAERADKALAGITGKRLTYRRINGQEEARG
ncbi:MAG: IS1595 family transposase [Alphaproteobacteria bacterium]